MKIRKLVEEDRALLASMIAGDAESMARRGTPDFYFAAYALTLVFSDERGVVLFLRLHGEDGLSELLGMVVPTIRCHMQFHPGERLRSARMLLSGFEVVKDRCRVSGARRMVFDSISADMREFCRRRFGFSPVAGTADMELVIED